MRNWKERVAAWIRRKPDDRQKKEKTFENVNRCVICNNVIPEGRHVCPLCEKKVECP